MRTAIALVLIATSALARTESFTCIQFLYDLPENAGYGVTGKAWLRIQGVNPDHSYNNPYPGKFEGKAFHYQALGHPDQIDFTFPPQGPYTNHLSSWWVPSESKLYGANGSPGRRSRPALPARS
jgi:hypothetical protein